MAGFGVYLNSGSTHRHMYSLTAEYHAACHLSQPRNVSNKAKSRAIS